MPESLSDELPPPVRLAIAYAPAPARAPWTALLTLDRKLARAALQASEPVLGQMRLAWWRDRFATPAADWPRGEPLLSDLKVFDGHREALAALVDGWELAVGGEPDAAALAALGRARADAIVALGRILRCDAQLGPIAAMASAWAGADLARTFGNAPGTAGDPGRLPRAMRPLPILLDLARRSDAAGLSALMRIVRLGLLGR